jgi:hypothetical protein
MSDLATLPCQIDSVETLLYGSSDNVGGQLAVGSQVFGFGRKRT